MTLQMLWLPVLVQLLQRVFVRQHLNGFRKVTNTSSDLEDLLQEVVTVNRFVDPNNNNPLG